MKQNSILSLGDSYTIGVGVREQDRWPVQLTDIICKQGLSYVAPTIVAENGWSTDELLAAAVDADLADCYSLVTLLIGVNNQYRGWPVDTFRSEFIELLNFCSSKSGNRRDRVIVLSIPDWGVTPFGIHQGRQGVSREIDLFNRVILEETNRNNSHFVDVTGISRKVSDAQGEALLAEDGLHPSGSMYRDWAERVARLVLEMED